jgi:hypothetical protein
MTDYGWRTNDMKGTNLSTQKYAHLPVRAVVVGSHIILVRRPEHDRALDVASG